MPLYCVNKETNWPGFDHEVHKQGCSKWPSNRIDLGWHSTCYGAIAEARRHYGNVDGCAICSDACHQR